MGFIFYCHNSGTCKGNSQFLFGEESELRIPAHIRQMEDHKGIDGGPNLEKGAVAGSCEHLSRKNREAIDLPHCGKNTFQR